MRRGASIFTHEKFEVRNVERGDEEFLVELFRAVKGAEFAGLGLPPDALHLLLDMQYKAQKTAYASQFPNASHQIIVVNDKAAGRLVTNLGDDEVLLVDIALLEQHRGHGIGQELLQGVCDAAASRQSSVKLTVRFDNPALRLYQRAGFVQPGGDGLHLVMERKPFSQEESHVPVTSEEVSPQPDDPYSSAHFRSLQGQTLSAQSMNGISVHLVLEEVEPLRAANRPANAKVPVGDSFALIFAGPGQPILPTAMTQLTTSAGESLEIFLSAIGFIDGALHYESIFNRMGG